MRYWDNLKKASVVAMVFCFASFPVVVNAALVKCGDEGCGKDDIIKIIGTAANMIFGVSGSLALLFFVYGGVTLILSGGVSDKVTKGRTILSNATIGLIVIFCSSLIVTFVVDGLTSA